MTSEHPITPPPELVKQWWKKAQQADYSDGLPCWLNYVATQAARWGADQELEACCADLQMVLGPNQANWLRSVRRPKAPSLKEQALAVLDHTQKGYGLAEVDLDTIRRALESLPDQ